MKSITGCSLNNSLLEDFGKEIIKELAGEGSLPEVQVFPLCTFSLRRPAASQSHGNFDASASTLQVFSERDVPNEFDWNA